MLEEIKKKPIERNLTFKQLLQEYLDVKRYEVRESSFEKIEKAFEHHILPQLENMTLDKLTPQVLQKWKLSIEKKKLGLKAKQDIYAKFRAFLNYEVKMGNLPSNPLTRIGNFKDPNVVKKKKINYYTADEFKQFIAQALKYAEESNTLMAWDFYVFFNIAFYTGMRKGEIYALKWTDIDENNILHV